MNQWHEVDQQEEPIQATIELEEQGAMLDDRQMPNL